MVINGDLTSNIEGITSRLMHIWYDIMVCSRITPQVLDCLRPSKIDTTMFCHGVFFPLKRCRCPLKMFRSSNSWTFQRGCSETWWMTLVEWEKMGPWPLAIKKWAAWEHFRYLLWWTTAGILRISILQTVPIWSSSLLPMVKLFLMSFAMPTPYLGGLPPQVW